MNLEGRVAIVTGGTGGLGGCIAGAFIEAGASVALVYRESTELALQRAADFTNSTSRAIAVQANVSTAEGARAMVERTVAELSRIDVLVNNAAFNQWVSFADLDGLTEDIWSKIMTTNLTGPFLCSRAVAPIMKAQGEGRIINVSSIAGIDPGGSSIAYAVSKSGLNHLTRCLAVAMAPEILVNCVAPGMLEGTRMTTNLDPKFAQAARERALLRRAALKEDVADQVVAFARSNSTTGQTLVIDSGRVFH